MTTIDKDILEYITEEEYLKAISEIKSNEFKVIYEDEKTIVELYKKGKKVYTMIEKFGVKKLDEALDNIISLAV